MAQKTRAQLRGLFDSDGIVTKTEWADVVESLWNIADDGSGGGTTLYSGDSLLAGDRTADLNSHFLKFNSGGGTYFSVDVANQTYRLGNENSGFQFSADEASNQIILTDGNFSFGFDTNKVFLTLGAVPNYANQAAAIGAGLTAGNIYRTSSGGTSTLKIVE